MTNADPHFCDRCANRGFVTDDRINPGVRDGGWSERQVMCPQLCRASWQVQRDRAALGNKVMPLMPETLAQLADAYPQPGVVHVTVKLGA